MEANSSGFWDIAYRDNAPALLGVLRRYVKEMNIAQDLLHEVFITAIDKYDDYKGKGSFEGWLYRITVNTALMYLRDEHNNLVNSGSAAFLSVLDDDDSSDEHADDVRAAIEAAEFSDEELLAAVDRLPQHHKMVFNMYVMDDFSHKQIAAELNISPGTSKSHLARARKKIQKLLYDDAMSRKKKKDKRWISSFLLLFPAKEHYIDKLYRNGLSDFTIPPTGGSEFISAVIEQQAASAISATVQSAVFWGGKLSYIAACCGTAAITGTVCWLTMSENSPLNSDNNRMNNEVIVSDSVMYLPNQIEEDAYIFDAADIKESELEHNLVNTEPINLDADSSAETIVVKRQIIQRQTVVVRDTVFIIENE
jgi:RNA polymerase sigma factor (sigma-70 family)